MSEKFDDIRDSVINKMGVPFSDSLVSRRLLGSWAIEMRYDNIESVATVMAGDVVECVYTLCCINVLIVI